MFTYFIRVQFWMARNQWKSNSRSNKILFFLVILACIEGVWQFYLFCRNRITSLGSTGSILYLPILFGIIISFLFIGILQFKIIFDSFYGASDLTLLRLAPIPPVKVFLLKLLEANRLLILPIGLGGIILMAYGQAFQMGLTFYISTFLFLVGVAMLMASLSLIAVILSVRWLLLSKYYFALLIGGLLFTAFLYLVAYQLPVTIIAGPNTSLPEITNELKSLIAYFLPGMYILSLIFGSISMGAAFWVYQKIFFDGWRRLQETPIRQKGSTANWHILEKWAEVFFPSHRYIPAKDWIIWIRSRTRTVNLLAFPINLLWMLPILSSNPLIKFFGWMAWVLTLIIVTPLAVVTWTANLLVEEGRNWNLLRIMPISIEEILRYKVLGVAVPAVVVAGPVVLGAFIMVGTPFATVFYIIPLTLYLLAGYAASSVAIVSLTIDLQNKKPLFVKNSWGLPISLLSSILYTVLVFLTILSILESIPLGAGDSGWWNAIRNLSAVSWMQGMHYWALLVLAAIHALYWWTILRILKFSARRLRDMDIVFV